MIGLVLCGGKSVRMGADKGMLLVNNQTWASIAEKKLTSLNILVKFSVNTDQEITYGNLFQKENIILDNQTLNIGGPLKGILSAHLTASNEDLFVLACDLVDMDTSLMAMLLKEKDQNIGFEAYIFSNNDFYEPLCGIYTAKGLEKIANLYKEGNLKKHSMQSVLAQLHTRRMVLTQSDQNYFKNFNTPTKNDSQQL